MTASGAPDSRCASDPKMRGSIGATSRYLSYRARLSSSDPGATPTLSKVRASFVED